MTSNTVMSTHLKTLLQPVHKEHAQSRSLGRRWRSQPGRESRQGAVTRGCDPEARTQQGL